jgi:hypothetical protein
MFNQYDSVENRNTSAIKPTPAEILKAILSSIKIILRPLQKVVLLNTPLKLFIDPKAKYNKIKIKNNRGTATINLALL